MAHWNDCCWQNERTGPPLQRYKRNNSMD